MKFVDVAKSHPEIFTYVTFPVLETEGDFLEQVYEPICNSCADCLYAIMDRTSADDPNGAFAGVVSLTATNPTNAVTEMGALIFPGFQRTHVATNAIGLLLQYLLDPPTAGGLGLRRVEWKCHEGNAVSRRVALRMGFEFEGIARWDRVFPRGTIALPVDELEKRNGTKGELPGRHTAIYSIVWQEWDEKRRVIEEQMDRGRND